MATQRIFCQGINKIRLFSSFRREFTGGRVIFNKEQTSTTVSQPINSDVPGLSPAVVKTEEPVGPGAAKDGEYKVPEYFNYNNYSYFEAEVEMSKYRLPVPSALEN